MTPENVKRADFLLKTIAEIEDAIKAGIVVVRLTTRKFIDNVEVNIRTEKMLKDYISDMKKELKELGVTI